MSTFKKQINADDSASKTVAPDLLWQVLEVGPAAIAMIDPDGKFIHVNQQFVEMTGYSREEIIGQHTRRLKSGARPAEEYRELWSCVLSGKKWTGEFQNRRKSGEIYWERASITPICYDSGQIMCFVKSAVETTREHVLECGLKDRNHLLGQISESIEELIAYSLSDSSTLDDSQPPPSKTISHFDDPALAEGRLRMSKRLQHWTSQLQESLSRLQYATNELHESRERYERLVRVTNGFVYSVTLQDGEVIDVKNYPGCESVTGYTVEEYEQDLDLWRQRIHPEDLEKVLLQVKALSEGQPVFVVEYRIYHQDGGLRWLRDTSMARRDSDGPLIGYEGLITDITDFKNSEAERQALTDQLREMALRDSVTGLMNRWGFEEELKRLWNLALRHAFPIGMLVIDIDHFKTLNDSYGHVVGDHVLAECARLVMGLVRESDAVCRLGGDEFTVILPWSEAKDTRLVANRILDAFRSHTFCKGEHDLRATVSIGAANVIPQPGFPASRFLTIADKALYRAKQRGRNRVCDWDKERET